MAVYCDGSSFYERWIDDQGMVQKRPLSIEELTRLIAYAKRQAEIVKLETDHRKEVGALLHGGSTPKTGGDDYAPKTEETHFEAATPIAQSSSADSCSTESDRVAPVTTVQDVTPEKMEDPSTLPPPGTLSKVAGRNGRRQPADIDRLILVTVKEDAEPSVGYLVPACESQDISKPCLRLQTTQDGKLSLEFGRVSLSTLRTCPVEIHAKQTTKQKWLSTIWNKDFRHLDSGPEELSPAEGFTAVSTILPSEIYPSDLRNLLSMWQSEYWNRKADNFYSRRTALEAFGVQTTGTNEFYTLYNRLKIEIKTSRFYRPMVYAK